jgi:hypothetical protein
VLVRCFVDERGNFAVVGLNLHDSGAGAFTFGRVERGR